ncbi:hypothetical protein PIB30_029203 [Stylosanthes scabra]|uniref:Uncharacterized protein n=1 Tax=Stylosanthes scabra TaxID=79078 RepID=A0ABU6QAX5_9FABA|nr:hypothetical protein [Stylosanthes scabra]
MSSSLSPSMNVGSSSESSGYCNASLTRDSGTLSTIGEETGWGDAAISIARARRPSNIGGMWVRIRTAKIRKWINYRHKQLRRPNLCELPSAVKQQLQIFITFNSKTIILHPLSHNRNRNPIIYHAQSPLPVKTKLT